MSADGRITGPPAPSDELVFAVASPPILTPEAAAVLLRILRRAVPSTETESIVKFENQEQ